MSNSNDSKPIGEIESTSVSSLTAEQLELLLDVDRQVRLSAQHTSRTRLRDALPSVINKLSEDENHNDFETSNIDNVVNRERWLSTIWPCDKTINEIDAEHAHQIYEDVKVFYFESQNFEKNLTTMPDLVGMHIVSSTCETEEQEYDEDDEDSGGDDYETNYKNNLVVISPMVIVRIEIRCEEYNDEDYDANVSVFVHISENPQNMLRVLRLQIKDFPPDEKGNETEENLSRIFGRDYFPPEDIENTPKKIRPS